MEFNLAEKLAIVKMIYSVILADGKVHPGEIDALTDLMHSIDFDSNFILQANSLSDEQGELLLKSMPEDKKEALATMLEDMAQADGFVHEKEMALILSICTSMGICRTVE